MTGSIEFNIERDAWVVSGPQGNASYRLIVPCSFVDDEIGKDAPDKDHLAWIRANLHHIIGAYTARIEGGWVKSPWDRVLVEEVD